MNYQEQIAAIVSEIAPVMKDRFDAQTYAAAMLADADDEETYFEVRGLHTKSGNPHTFSID